ncbi:hypothetical protein GIW32_10760 [Pseudomonas syringae]|nr:hypothetical protein [Pseudomonas syringae]MCF5241781.1 hypothetical protein [Pseudomonas syringae]
MLAVRRLANHEGGRSGLAVLFYERGPKLGWQMMTELLMQSIESGQLRIGNPVVATAHLRARYEAELMEPSILGVTQNIGRAQLKAMVKRSVEIFLLAYGQPPAE